jgi:molybdopterin converting factor small subunit
VKSRYPDLNLNEDNVITTVNQEKAFSERLLKAGDIISFLPFISGG